MPLTTAQLQVLKADILADPILNSFPNNADGAFEIANAYNLDATPAFWVWRTQLSKREVTSNVSPDGTTFSFPALISRSAGEQFGWGQVWNSTLECDPSLPNVRQAFSDIFSGGTGAAQRAHLLAMARRLATRIEKLFATGTGTTGSPATMTFVGPIPYSDIEQARNLA